LNGGREDKNPQKFDVCQEINSHVVQPVLLGKEGAGKVFAKKNNSDSGEYLFKEDFPPTRKKYLS